MKSLIKNISTLSILFSAVIFFQSCEETCPGVIFTTPVTGDTVSVPLDATLASQKRNVILQDYTGVRCVNCPDGHLVAKTIQDSYAEGRVVTVALHSGIILTGPYPFGTHDFRTTEGDDIESLVGPISSKPIGDINRRLFSGQSGRPVARSLWSGFVAQEMADSIPKVQMKTEHTFDNATRILSLDIILQFAESISNNLNMHVMLTESGLIEPQLGGPNGGPTGIDTFYVHNHVLRDMITPSVGSPIIGNKSPGHATKYLMPDFEIPASWNADSVHIVTFVTVTDSLNVLQVIENKLK